MCVEALNSPRVPRSYGVWAEIVTAMALLPSFAILDGLYWLRAWTRRATLKYITNLEKGRAELDIDFLFLRLVKNVHIK